MLINLNIFFMTDDWRIMLSLVLNPTSDLQFVKPTYDKFKF